MAVPCPGCGRDYDVALFQFGRTIHCTCGARVGLEPRVERAPVELRFMVDAMLGRLARWLRVMGYDARFEAGIADADLVRIAIREDRVLLTRDRALVDEWRVPRLVLLASESAREQLREVAGHYPLDWRGRVFSRCTRCNDRVERAPPEEVAGRVPPSVLSRYERFYRCPACARIYWDGSHAARMRRALEDALPH
jgi:uncharacterized protein with PIN domain